MKEQDKNFLREVSDDELDFINGGTGTEAKYSFDEKGELVFSYSQKSLDTMGKI